MGDRWFEEELAGCRLGDGRLDSRLRQLVEQMEAGFGESIPLTRPIHAALPLAVTMARREHSR